MLGPGVPVTSRETFHWLEGGYFLVSSYETVFGDEPAQKGVNYWGYDSAAERFRIVFFSNNGPFTEEGNSYEGELIDGELTFEGPARFRYELDDQGAIRVNPDGTISVAWWLRDDSGDWQPWMNNTYARAGGGSAVIKGVSKVVVAVERPAAGQAVLDHPHGLSRHTGREPTATSAGSRWLRPTAGRRWSSARGRPANPGPRCPTCFPIRRSSSPATTSNGRTRSCTERGVEFMAPPAQMHFGWWALFSDQEGTRYALGQWE